MPKKLPAKPNLPEMEEAVLQFWNTTHAFEASVEMRPKDKPYVFYDGPPFATGMPHYGHLLASTIKDVIPRYQTMKGFRVERVWGWDCHGLPIENMIEQQLDIKGGKKGIEEMGVAPFNQACRAEVLRLDKEWETIINRLGRWVDFERSYKTMDTSYMESVWWGFKQLYDKNLVYQGRKVVMYCPRCATPLSNFEIAMDNSYEDTEDWSIYPLFQITANPDGSVPSEPTYFVAWTTTPWTLPGNVALAVDESAEYSLVYTKETRVWLATERLDSILGESEHTVIKTKTGAELVGTRYQPLFTYLEEHATTDAWSVLPADFVSLEDGTGIVHTAVMYGEDDFTLSKTYDLPLIPTLDSEGKFFEWVSVAPHAFYKLAEKRIIEDLETRGAVFFLEKITHSYPYCYRCSTPLYYSAEPAWFIDVQHLKERMLETNEEINWFPEHLKYGRFGKGVAAAPDWNISRSRYWGTPMPIWCSSDGEYRRVIGSLEELQKWAVEPSQVADLTDIHREFVDPIAVWVDDKKTIKGERVPEVFDCWVESGSMPFASRHYPFANKKEFDATYPAQFVSEYIAQTRAWFYTMHVMSVGVFNAIAFQNVVTTGNILGSDGQKMSKSKKNYPDPMVVVRQYGADSLRLYLMSSPVMKGENLSFQESDVADLRKRVFLIWYNMVAFYTLYADTDSDYTQTKEEEISNLHVMDRWILSKLSSLTREVTTHLDSYDVVKASRALIDAVSEISTWYLRRSRDRIRDGEGEARAVFYTTLTTLATLFAPFTPFFSEWVHHALVDDQTSIHHTDWPRTREHYLDATLEQEMQLLRSLVEIIHAQRSAAGIKVRQPLGEVIISSPQPRLSAELLEVLKEEVNIKTVVWNQVGEKTTAQLDTRITPELKVEGEVRELIRRIQKLRKEAGLSVGQHAVVSLSDWPEDWRHEIEA
ncbi:isoleucine--tRNA ligase, partial [Candidatus Woesebacteria bacterium]|nr:isoleucine--tRNA ligase [Candidatus Woesebacteria bacterium]